VAGLPVCPAVPLLVLVGALAGGWIPVSAGLRSGVQRVEQLQPVSGPRPVGGQMQRDPFRRPSDGCDRSWAVWDRFTCALVVGGSLGRWGVTFLAAVAGFEVASLG
jgi:hypothetical protein